MKKVVLILMLLILCGCSSKDTEVINKIDGSLNSKEEAVYKDTNPVNVSLYLDNAYGGLDKADKEFKDTWKLKRDIVILSSLYSEEKIIAEDYFQNMWKNAAEKYEDYKKYKTGWYINFKLKDGTVIDQMIFSPKDVEYFYDYLELYLYDSANQPIGQWYSHLTEEQITTDTILTTLKLTAGSKYEEIIAPISVSVYTYDDESDFDEGGKYRGNSISNIQIYNN